MTISYKWLSEYLPEQIAPEKLSRILTSIGLEVESMEAYESFKGGLKGLVVGEVLTCEKHPNADKLRLTTVNIGNEKPLHVVCGAPNVAAGQKVIVATVGTTIYPLSGEPLTMKLAKIRGEQSEGMICAEDEIGLSSNHDGILVLPADTPVGMQAADYFGIYEDVIYEIGLTPNRMDAMSHWGVARDVCAYLSHHENKNTRAKIPTSNSFAAVKEVHPIKVIVENYTACPRYSGITIDHIVIKESPNWLKNKLKAIGLKPINNIVDITNFIQHETGQPLHAFDADKIEGNTVIVKNLEEGSPFITLDGKEKKLSKDDLMICDNNGGMCIAGVYGGLNSGVTDQTKRIFLESAFFDPTTIRKTSFKHLLRTDAATRFEKGTDISATVNVLKRATLLIQELAEGKVASDLIDIYPEPKEKTEIRIRYHYLKKLSGKNYHPDSVKDILTALGFEVLKEDLDTLTIAVPFSKPDISLPADIVEEVLRIDGLDNIEIPTAITITPSIETNFQSELYKEKLANYLVGLGFNETLTNSITDKKYYTDEELANAVIMKNSLSADLNMMRPSMIDTGLEVVAHNINRKNDNLRLFEFGRTYQKTEKGFTEQQHIAFFITGKYLNDSWKQKATTNDFFTIKGIIETSLKLIGINNIVFNPSDSAYLDSPLQIMAGKKTIGTIGIVNQKTAKRFGIDIPVYFADLYWDTILPIIKENKIAYRPISKFPAVNRDIAVVVDKNITYQDIKNSVHQLNLKKLQNIQLFDIFESEKLGVDKKSMAISCQFIDEEKTLTDIEVEGWMKKIIQSLEKNVNAGIRS